MKLVRMDILRPYLDQIEDIQVLVNVTENLYKAAETVFLANKYKTTNLKKLIVDTKAAIASGKTIEEIYYINNRGTIAISATDSTPAITTIVKPALIPLLDKDITALAVEPVRKKSIQDIGVILNRDFAINKTVLSKILFLITRKTQDTASFRIDLEGNYYATITKTN